MLFRSGDKKFKEYDLQLPHEGDWRVRFNSSWKGYSVDFHETPFSNAAADKTGKATVSLAAFSAIIISIDAK